MSNWHRDTEAELQRLHEQVDDYWPKEVRILTALGLVDGMTILDAGSGPGFFTERLLNLLPACQVIDVEHDPATLDWAQHYLGEVASKRVRFVEADVRAVPLPDATCDFVIARFLLQHVPDPQAVLREMARLLKPGGKIAILDGDDEIVGIFDPFPPSFGPILPAFQKAQAMAGGDRFLGRRLLRLMKAVGFVNMDLEIIAKHSDSHGVDSFRGLLDADRMVRLVRAGVLTDAELEQFRTDVKAFFANPDAYVLMLLVLAHGEKPTQ
jgi:SAM-dependent methyltransferase